ncbi:retrovirus-related Pol polyprotein from transposon 297 [Trichonephila clavipes]|nr:retrovirus-related Pol polyprotein from transposon 297 [Trichonephila clavipes]
MKVIELKQIIVGSKNFEEEFVKNLLETVMNERMESENLEKQTLAREIQLEKETLKREFHLECLRVKQNTVTTKSVGKTNLVEHDIDLISDKQVQHKPYRMTNRQNEILKAEIERMLKYKIIEPGPSEYTSPMILVEMPGRDLRPCIDYRKLNEMMRTEFDQIPNIEQRVETVAAVKLIT